MDNLRPERDELDQFRDRKTKQRAKPDVVPPSATKVKTAAAPKSGSPFMLVLVVMLVAGLSFLGWEYTQQKQVLAKLKAEQEDAAGFIGQSKLLLARLEGELSETGAEMAQSGSVVDKKLAFLDAEMRKLWGVSNDRNKKLIQNNEEALAKLADRLSGLEQLTQSLKANADVLRTSLTDRVEQVSEVTKVMRSTLDSVSGRVSDVASSSVVVLAEVETVKQDMQELRALNGKFKETDKILASVDASRQQLVQRVVELEKRLNELRLNDPSSATPKPNAGLMQPELPGK